MKGHDILVVGASAGGVAALRTLFATMPAGTAATVFVVQHVAPEAMSVLPAILSRSGWLPAFHPRDGEPIRPNHVHVAPPDHHLLVKRDRVLVRRGPKENRTRPAIDPLFRSAAVAFGPRVVGVVLTGLLDDGTAGLHAIKRCGGSTVVQDPADAEWPGMPRNALAHVAVDHCAALADLPDILCRLIHEPPGPPVPVPADIVREAEVAEKEFTTMSDDTQTLGRPTTLSCPDCGGGLSEIADGPLLRFRCQVGHAFSAEALTAAQREEVERALWVALRTHEDRVNLYERLAEHARSAGRTRVATKWDEHRHDARTTVELLRSVLSRVVPLEEKANEASGTDG
ncbi:chemotaxis protein CheB [Azospirillum sp. ST 5-10]|uniref:chemotaxis protein CheB n=1 Tax=unclassified Azospirillum TaxID=2630922 RepID=UPI003F4A312C